MPIHLDHLMRRVAPLLSTEAREEAVRAREERVRRAEEHLDRREERLLLHQGLSYAVASDIGHMIASWRPYMDTRDLAALKAECIARGLPADRRAVALEAAVLASLPALKRAVAGRGGNGPAVASPSITEDTPQTAEAMDRVIRFYVDVLKVAGLIGGRPQPAGASQPEQWHRDLAAMVSKTIGDTLNAKP